MRVGAYGRQYAFFYACETMNNPNAVGFADHKDDDTNEELMRLLFLVFMSNHCRRGIVTEKKERPSARTVMTMSEVVNPGNGRRVGFMFLMWEVNPDAPGGNNGDEGVGPDQKVSQDRRMTLEQRNRNKLPISEWCDRIFREPKTRKLLELAYSGSKASSQGKTLDAEDVKDWSLLCEHDASSRWARAAAVYKSGASRDFALNRIGVFHARADPRFSDQAWEFGPDSVFSVANAVAHLARRVTEFRPQREYDMPIPLNEQDFLQRFQYSGGPPAYDMADGEQRLEAMFMSNAFSEMVNRGRTWEITPTMAHPREFERYKFPELQTEGSFDTSIRSWRNYMSSFGVQTGTLDVEHKAHVNFVDLLLCDTPVSAEFDTIQSGIRARAMEIAKVPDRARRRQLELTLHDQFTHFWNASNRGGGPLREWIRVSNEFRHDTEGGFSLVGQTPHSAPELSAVDSFVDTMYVLASSTFHILHHQRIMVALLFGVVDAARRGSRENTVRIQMMLQGPPGTGKSILLSFLRVMLPEYAYSNSSHDTKMTSLSLGDRRVEIKMNDDVQPIDVGIEPPPKGQTGQKSIYDLLKARLNFDPAQNTGGGFAVQQRKMEATGSKQESRAATFADGHRDAVTTKNVVFGTTLENGNLNRWLMNYALMTRIINIPVYMPRNAGVSIIPQSDIRLDAEQTARFSRAWFTIMALVVELNSQIECMALPDVDVSLAGPIYAALVSALQKMGYGTYDIALLRKREQITYIARSQAVINAITCVYGDLGINATESGKPYEHKDMRLLAPYLWVSRGMAFYAAEMPNVFVDEETMMVAKLIVELVLRFTPPGQRGTASSAARGSGVQVSEVNDSRSSIGVGSDETANSQLAEISRNASLMGAQFPIGMRAENMGGRAAAAASAASGPGARPVIDGYHIVERFFEYKENKFTKEDADYDQPSLVAYAAQLYRYLAPKAELQVDKEAITNAIIALCTASDGRRPPMLFKRHDLWVDMKYMTTLPDVIYRTLQELYVNTKERVVWRRYPSQNDRALTGVVGSALGGMSYEDLIAAEEMVRDGEEKARREQEPDYDGDDAGDVDDYPGAAAAAAAAKLRARAAAQSKYIDLGRMEYTALDHKRPSSEGTDLKISSTILNPDYVDQATLKDRLRRGFLTAEQYKARLRAGSSRTFDTNNLTDYSVAMRIARELADDPEQAKLYHSIPHNHKRLKEAHCEFSAAALDLQLLLVDIREPDDETVVDTFVDAWLKTIMAFARRCGAYKTYYGFNGEVTAALVMRYLTALKCVPTSPPDRPTAYPPAKVMEFATLIAQFAQRYVAAVQTIRVESDGRDLPNVQVAHSVEQHDSAAANDYTSLQAKVKAYWSICRPGTVAPYRISGEDTFEAPSRVYVYYRDCAFADEDLMKPARVPAAAAAAASGARAPPPRARAAAAARPPVAQQPPSRPIVRPPVIGRRPLPSPSVDPAPKPYRRPAAAAAAAAGASDRDELMLSRSGSLIAPSVSADEAFDSLFSTQPVAAAAAAAVASISEDAPTLAVAPVVASVAPPPPPTQPHAPAAAAASAAVAAPSAFASLFPRANTDPNAIIRPKPPPTIDQMLQRLGSGQKRKSTSRSESQSHESGADTNADDDDDGSGSGSDSGKQKKKKRKHHKKKKVKRHRLIDDQAAESSDSDQRESDDESGDDVDGLAPDEELGEDGFAHKKGEEQESARRLARDGSRLVRRIHIEKDAEVVESAVKRYDSMRTKAAAEYAAGGEVNGDDEKIVYDTHDGAAPAADDETDELKLLKLPTPPRRSLLHTPPPPLAPPKSKAPVKGRLKKLDGNIEAMFRAGLEVETDLTESAPLPSQEQQPQSQPQPPLQPEPPCAQEPEPSGPEKPPAAAAAAAEAAAEPMQTSD